MQSTRSSTRTFITPPAKSETPAPKKQPKLGARFVKKQLPWIIIAVLVIVSAFLFFEYHLAQNKLNSNSQQYYATMTKKLGKLILLPANETPTIVTVKDANKARSQVFYADSQNGDITFVYSKEHKAILYRPSENIIVNVAAVNLTTSGSSSPPSQ